jgi:ribonuclease HIII
MEHSSSEYQIKIPKGASEKVREVGRQLIEQHGRGILEDVAKTHFKTASDLLDATA